MISCYSAKILEIIFTVFAVYISSNIFSLFTFRRNGASGSLPRYEDSILTQLIKEALDIILYDCHRQRLLPPKISKHMDSVLKEKPEPKLKSKHGHRIPKIKCRNIRVLLYYAQNVFCWVTLRLTSMSSIPVYYKFFVM